MTLPRRPLGRSGLEVSAIGLGCMGMSEFYGPVDELASVRAFDRAVELGIDFFDTADMYGSGRNEELVGRLARRHSSRLVIATKFGILRDPDNPELRAINGRPEYVRAACEASLRRLGLGVIDLYYAHRLDPQVPVEETVGAMADLVRQGKVRALGLSEVSVAELRRAIAVHPIAAVQSELSLWSRDQEPVEAACAELGVSFVPYSPLGRGLLAGAVREQAELAPDDFRRTLPRFQGENLSRNARLAAGLDAVGQRLGRSRAQLALAWLLAKGEHVVPIPGTRRADRVEENVAAASFTLTAEERSLIEEAASSEAVAGGRYPAWVMERMAAAARAAS